MPSSFLLPFIERKQETEDTYSFFFQRPPEFDFKPGQYLRLILPTDHPDERGTSRFFSIASSPTEKDHFRVTTRIIQSTFKKTLYSLTPGQIVSISGPYGQFVLNDTETRPIVLLAGGIGITPYRNMLVYTRDKHLTIPITLLSSFSRVEDIIFFDELTAIDIEMDNISYIVTITKPEESKKPWNGETGRMNEEMLKRYIANLSESLYYIVGPPGLVAAMRELVEGLRVGDENIITEDFTGY